MPPIGNRALTTAQGTASMAAGSHYGDRGILVRAVSAASLSVGQMQFLYDQSPETMRGASTAFYFLSISLGNLINSQLVTLVATVTSAGGRTGWFPPELDDGHLDYYFWLWAVISAGYLLLYLLLAARYTPKQVLRHSP